MTKRPLLAGSRRIENAIGNLMDIGKNQAPVTRGQEEGQGANSPAAKEKHQGLR